MIEFNGEYADIPSNIQGSITRYVENKLQPGSFLTAVLNNDLKNAVLKADVNSLKSLKLIVLWFSNNRPNLYGTDNFLRHLGSK